jgi:hypothetical protein
MDKHAKAKTGMINCIIASMIKTMRDAQAPLSHCQEQLMRETVAPALDRVFGELYDDIEKLDKKAAVLEDETAALKEASVVIKNETTALEKVIAEVGGGARIPASRTRTQLGRRRATELAASGYFGMTSREAVGRKAGFPLRYL